MAINSMSDHLLMQWAKHPDLKTDKDSQEMFMERFTHQSFREQYEILAYMFINYTEIELQPWIMNLANKLFKQKAPGYTQSQFKSKASMVEFFIRNYSFDPELEQMRSTIWTMIK
jgi:hypothetical protein